MNLPLHNVRRNVSAWRAQWNVVIFDDLLHMGDVPVCLVVSALLRAACKVNFSIRAIQRRPLIACSASFLFPRLIWFISIRVQMRWSLQYTALAPLDDGWNSICCYRISRLALSSLEMPNRKISLSQHSQSQLSYCFSTKFWQLFELSVQCQKYFQRGGGLSPVVCLLHFVFFLFLLKKGQRNVDGVASKAWHGFVHALNLWLSCSQCYYASLLITKDHLFFFFPSPLSLVR